MKWHTAADDRARLYADATPQNEKPDPVSKIAADLRNEFERHQQQLVEQARQQGYAQGEAAAREQASREMAVLEQRVARTVEECASLRPRLRRQVEQQAVELALAIARRILYRQIQMDPEALTGLVRAAMDKVGARDVTQIRVTPAQVRAIQSVLASLGTPHAVQVIPDPSLEWGSLIIGTQSGELDVSVQTQLDEIERGFADLCAADVTLPAVIRSS